MRHDMNHGHRRPVDDIDDMWNNLAVCDEEDDIDDEHDDHDAASAHDIDCECDTCGTCQDDSHALLDVFDIDDIHEPEPSPYDPSSDKETRPAQLSSYMSCNAEDWTPDKTNGVPFVIIELCCSEASPISMCADEFACVVRFIERSDLTQPSAVKIACDIIESFPMGRLLLRVSLPCTGRSQLQRLNEARVAGQDKRAQHLQLHGCHLRPDGRHRNQIRSSDQNIL